MVVVDVVPCRGAAVASDREATRAIIDCLDNILMAYS